jgi:hypothetical protein
MSPPRAVARFALGVGACEALTGVALVAAPRASVAAMGIALGAADAVYLRWIGAFVLAVGLAYLYALLPGAAPARRAPRLRAALEITALARGAVALVTAGAIVAGELAPRWAGVPLYDAALAAAQLAILARGGLDDG